MPSDAQEGVNLSHFHKERRPPSASRPSTLPRWRSRQCASSDRRLVKSGSAAAADTVSSGSPATALCRSHPPSYAQPPSPPSWPATASQAWTATFSLSAAWCAC
eukprot:CAMPEP_0117501134 /NCGR_PEP_ID=MMETSP0784-20121206/23138_1 /TAXON_ID=39447 /ORGANISM="" /LENGTH=103 /DNA_ID=CAMNT_0005296371 /DNA_START=171 /DNA_END=482 /DNA_ORIENTATION=-